MCETPKNPQKDFVRNDKNQHTREANEERLEPAWIVHIKREILLSSSKKSAAAKIVPVQIVVMIKDGVENT